MASIECRKAHPMNVCEGPVLFQREASSYEDVLSRLNYQGNGEIPKRHVGWTNEIDGIPRHSPTVKMYVVVTRRNGEKRSQLARIEQREARWIWDLADELLKPGERGFNLFSSTFSIAKACLEPPPLSGLWAMKLMQTSSQQVWSRWLRRIRYKFRTRSQTVQVLKRCWTRAG